jgi:hypothetical protein
VELPDDNFLYVVAVSPSIDASAHRAVLTRAVESFQILNRPRAARTVLAADSPAARPPQSSRAPVTTTR